MRTYIAPILLTLAIGLTCAVQADTHAHLEGVLRLIAAPCVSSDVDSAPFMKVPATDQLLTFLERELNNTIRSAMEASEALKDWSALLDNQKITRWQAYVKKLQIPKTQHGNLSEVENSRMHVYFQLANYANFLMKQETANYNTNPNGSRRLPQPDLRVQIRRVMCKLRELLQPNSEALRVFAAQDVAGHLLPLETMALTSSIKRAVCAIVVDLMFDTIKQIRVFKETGLVQIPVNI